MTCPNCGTKNPTTNRFCQNCGHALEAVPVAASVPNTAPPPQGKGRAGAEGSVGAAGPAVITAPAPVAAAAVTASPAPPRSALPLPALIGLIVGGMLLVSVVGLLVLRGALGTQHGDPGPDPGPSVPPSNPAPISGQTVDQQNVAITLPAGWTLVSQGPTQITLKPAAGGELTVASLRRAQAHTSDQLIQEDLAIDQKVDANARICKGPFAVAIPNLSRAGTGAVICYVQTRQDGSSFEAIDYVLEGVGSDNSIEFEVEVWAPRSIYDAVLAAAVPVASTVKWKLPS